MSKPYALRMLLEHGPMHPREITECTRWTSKQVHSNLWYLRSIGAIRKTGEFYKAAS